MRPSIVHLETEIISEMVSLFPSVVALGKRVPLREELVSCCAETLPVVLIGLIDLPKGRCV